MHAVIVGAGMGGMFAALSLRESGQFKSIDLCEQTQEPSTAGAGLNIPPNGARLCQWLGVDLDGGDPKGAHGAIDGGRAAILDATRGIMPDGSVSIKPLDHNTAAGDGAGFHHMHRLDLLMCLYKRVFEMGPASGVDCPIQVHMGKHLETLRQDEATAYATFSDGSDAQGDVLVGADGINSKTLRLLWPAIRLQTSQKRTVARWTTTQLIRSAWTHAKTSRRT
jgi:salicylate hydroxylase